VEPPSTSPPRRRRRTAAAFVAAVAAVVAAAGCQPATYSDRAGSPRIAVVGDSLIWAAQPPTLTALHTRGWSASVTGTPGHTVADQIPYVSGSVMPTDPHAVVVALGTNDVRLMADGAQTWDGLRRDIRRMIDVTRNARCLIWVGVNDTSGFYRPGVGNLAEVGWAVNWTIAEELERAGRPAGTAVYADWASVSRNPTFYVAPGDPHHTPAGQQAYTNLIRTAADRCAGAPLAGTVDSITGGVGGVQLRGWVVDPDRPSAAGRVHVYVNGVFHRELRANGSRPDVGAAYPQWGGNHGYAASVALPPGRFDVCIWGIDEHGPPAANPLLRCAAVQVSATRPPAR
jgi:hypothetical protein